MKYDLEKRFSQIYHNNRWNSKESRSGKGSELAKTVEVRKIVPDIIKKYNIKSILDIPCGDFNYMKEIEIECDYIGADIVYDLIESNKRKYPEIDFRHLNLISDNLPKSDLVICRDCLVHLNTFDCIQSILNIKNSRAKYLLVTSFIFLKNNIELPRLGWRKMNMELPPYNFRPIEIFNEKFYNDNNRDKSLILVDMHSL